MALQPRNFESEIRFLRPRYKSQKVYLPLIDFICLFICGGICVFKHLYSTEHIETNVNFKKGFGEGHRRSWIGVKKEVWRKTLYSYVKFLEAVQEEEEKKKGNY